MESQLGVVGLGNMGLPIVGRLIECGNPVLVYDKDAGRCGAAVERGAVAAGSLAEVAGACDVILLSLPTPVVVSAVVPELLDTLAPGAVVVDLSTNDARTPRDMAHIAAQRGVSYVDAPVSGGPSRAATGELTTMVGGDEQAVARVMPVLSQVAKEVEYVGPSGSGGIAKLLNNFVAIWNMVGVSQAFLAGEALGMSPERLYAVMSKSSGRSYSLDRNYPKIRDENYRPNFAAVLAEKDFRLALDLLADAGVRALADDELRSLFIAAARDRPQDDLAVIHELLRPAGSRQITNDGRKAQ
jgi:3-hydroxyisobutyrate dehydrogenase-like beta-hydroxyacid dehydrogenase